MTQQDEYKEYVFEFEDLENKMRVIRFTLSCCFANLLDGTSEETECVISGILQRIVELSEEMEKHKTKGFEIMRRGIRNDHRGTVAGSTEFSGS